MPPESLPDRLQPPVHYLEALARERHSHQMRRLRMSYLAMVARLSDTPMRARLLAMDLAGRADDQVRTRVTPFGVTTV